MRWWGEPFTTRRWGRGEDLLLPALLVCWAIFLWGMGWLAGARDAAGQLPAVVHVSPWDGCRPIEGAHTWAPEGKRIVHLECPE